MKKILCLLLAMSLAFSVAVIAPATASAAEQTQTSEEKTSAQSGTSGDCTWTLDDEGTLTISGTGMSDPVYYYLRASEVKNVIINDGVTYINKNTFYGCYNLFTISIPDSVTEIGEKAIGYYFDYEYEREEKSPVIIYGNKGSIAENYADENSFEFVSEHYGETGGCTWTLDYKGTLTISGTGVYDTDYSICIDFVKAVVINDGITGIENFAFGFYSNLTSVTIPNSVTSIGYWAFKYCENLKSVTIPDSVTEIGEEAFGYYRDKEYIDTIKKYDITIYGYSGNIAAYYAKENGFKFVSLGESQNPATFDEATPDEATPDEATPDEATPDEATTDEATPDEATPDEATPDEATSDEATPDEATPDEPGTVIPKEVGDSNGDGAVDVLDAVLIQKYVVGKTDLSDLQLEFSDVNLDGAVDVLDSVDIQKYLVEKITEFKNKKIRI